jgi:hypothetical protein
VFNLIKTKEYLGYASISPQNCVIAGETGTWEMTYVVGKYGFDDAGSLRFAWRTVSDWGIPQFDRPNEEGYTTVWTNGHAKISAAFDVFERPFGNSILLKLSEGFLAEGDIIKITMGDTSKGSCGISAQSYCESEHAIKVFVDCFGTKVMEELPECIVLNVVSGPLHKVEAVIHPTVTVGEKFEILIRALDEFGNSCRDYEGEVFLTIPEFESSEYSIPASVFFTKNDKGSKRITECIIYKEGPFHVKAKEANSVFETLSNGGTVRKVNEYNLFWGDMHGQTNFTIGTGSLDEYFSFARDVGGVDFTGWQGNDFEIDDEKWLSVREKTKEYNAPEKFIVFLGYEWSGVTPRGGDHNVYFLDDNEHFYPSSNGLDRKHKTDLKYNAPFVNDLYKICAGRKDVLTIPHVGGRHGNLDYYNPEFTSVIEIHSHHGTFEWFAKEAMRRRIKVGFVASSDDHTCRPGLSYPLGKSGNTLTSFDVGSGYVGVYAKSLTREGIWEALKNRRCYASDMGRIRLAVHVDSHWMGEEINCAESPEIKVSVVGSSPVDTIQLYNWDELIQTNNMRKKSKNKIRISWSGVRVRTRKKSASWDGQLHIKNGKILSAKEYAFDKQEQGIKFISNQKVTWTSNTSGEYDGIILDIESREDTKLYFSSKQTRFSLDAKEITEYPITFSAGGEDLKVEVVLANEEILTEKEYLDACSKDIVVKAPVIQEGLNAYWARVLLKDGHMAWSSPIFVNYSKQETL